MIDKTCVLWNSHKCVGDTGTCLEYDSSYFHYILFGTSLGIKVVSSILLVLFSLYIHKSYVLKRRYQNSVTLNHDLTSIMTSKQKYKVDTIAIDVEDDDETAKQKNRKPNMKNVVLNKLTLYDDNNFTSFDRSETPDFFKSLDDKKFKSTEIDAISLNTMNNTPKF